ncbi:hypothetical protein GQ53DRAFT_423474 [Thozetella sp. PMI_491]|nr:hypothetical protein GQ53DRAFT_423474 [Thozetella sp. PMI_491]
MDWRRFHGFGDDKPRRNHSPAKPIPRGSRKDDVNTPQGSDAIIFDSPQSNGDGSHDSPSSRQSSGLTGSRPRVFTGYGLDKEKASGSNDIPYPNFPRIDVAIHDLGNELYIALREYQGLVVEFENAVAPIKNWAEASTLDKIWTNLIDKVGKAEERRNRTAQVTTLRIAGCKQILAGCLENVNTERNKRVRKERDWEEEDKARMAEKLIVHCHGIIDVSRDALHNRQACDYFIHELQDATAMLSNKRHVWISEATIKAVDKVKSLSTGDRAGSSRGLALSETDEHATRGGRFRNTESGASFTTGSSYESEAGPVDNNTNDGTVFRESATTGAEKVVDAKRGW